MAGSFLRQWFTKSRPLQPDVANAVAELKTVAVARPALAGSLTTLQDLLPLLYDDLPEPPAIALDHELASAKLSSGVPLLRGENLPLSDEVHRRRWNRICATARAHQSGEETAAHDPNAHNEQLAPGAMILEVLAGRPETPAAMAEELGVDGGMITTLLRLYWFPVLSAVRESLAPLLANVPWRFGHCPVCGSNPLLAELRGLEQGRFLRCGLCASAWEHPRLECPYCGTQDHHALGYFHLAGEETRYRVSTCDECRRYVKTIATLSELTGPSLLAADAMTLHLDLAAAERGYVV